MANEEKNNNSKIHVPYKRVRINVKTGMQEEHIFTEDEIKKSQEMGRIVLNENAVWQPFISTIERKGNHDKSNNSTKSNTAGR